ncbi:MAG: nuclear transport factor 2 family protein [Acidobacteria bacterium]|nr:nuclear transport factor 2 family protein [Acidobacteriota bacterium]
MSENNKRIVNEVNDALANNRVEDFLKHCSDDVVWRLVGEKSTNGIKEIRDWMAQMKGAEPPKFTVDEMIAESDSVVCRGDMTMKDQEGVEGKYSYCDFYHFKNGKIAQLDSYVIRLKPEGEGRRTANA